MKKLALIMMGLVVGILVFAQPGQRPERGEGSRDGRQDRSERMAEKLNLTEEQQAQMDELRTQFKGEVQSIENQLDIKRAELKAAISAEESRKVIDTFVEDINDLSNQRFSKEIDHMLQVRALLDEDQKVMFDSMKRGKGRSGHRRY